MCLYKLCINDVDCQSLFYSQILESWYSLFSRSPNTVKDIVNTQIWYNTFIRVDGKPVHYQDWSDKNILFVGQILSNTGCLLPKFELEQKYNLNIRVMDYNSLVHSIPREWKNAVKDKAVHNVMDKSWSTKMFIKSIACNIDNLHCKDFYWEFVSMISELPKSEHKWSEYTNTENICWQDIYAIPYSITRETYLQSFQYKIQHRFYPCNYTLSIWYKEHSNECTQCGNVDYLEHFFYLCGNVNLLWKSIINWWKNMLGCTIMLCCNDVIFGISNGNEDPVIDVMNLTILYAKYYIHMRKSNNDDIFFPDFLLFVKQKLEVEKMYCEINNINTFDKKWKVLYEHL